MFTVLREITAWETEYPDHVFYFARGLQNNFIVMYFPSLLALVPLHNLKILKSNTMY